MYNYNSMVNAFFKLDGHMFCLALFTFCFLPFAKNIQLQETHLKISKLCNLDGNGFEICLVRLFFLRM